MMALNPGVVLLPPKINKIKTYDKYNLFEVPRSINYIFKKNSLCSLNNFSLDIKLYTHTAAITMYF